jgi:hypothetical protein
MKKMINKTTIEGILVEKDLRAGVAEKTGVAYVSGRLHIETEPGNVVAVDVYESEKTVKGAVNQKYATLKGVYDNGQARHDGAYRPTTLRVSSALGTNDWYNKEGELVSSLINRGGFINITTQVQPKADFETDVVIKSVQPEIRQEQETGRVIVNGIIFNYANQALPARFIVDNAKGVEFFQNLDANTFTRVWGSQVNSTVTNERIEESAFGDAKVVKSSYSRKEFVITGAQTEAYDDTQMTTDELNQAIQARNVAIAQLKAKTEEYQASKGNASKPASAGTTKVAVGDFSF